MKERERSTPYAILGMLKLAPMSGYDIRREASSRIGYFWQESYGQIYPALRDLLARGLVRRRPDRGAKVPRDRRPGLRTRDRQVYQITKRGREALKLWRARPPRMAPPRNELLLKLFFGERRSVKNEIAWIEELAAQETSASRDFRRIRRLLRKERRDHASLPFWLMTLDYGEQRSGMALRWCGRTLRALRAIRGRAKRKARIP